MKNLLYFLLFMALVSCAEDAEGPANDDDQGGEQIEIFGTWKLVDWYEEQPVDINNDGQASTDLFSQWNGCKKQSLLVMETDFTGRIIYTGPDDNPKCPPGFVSGDYFTPQPWEIDDQNLIFIGDDYLDTYKIITLDNTTLVLKGAGEWTCCDPAISFYTDGYLRFLRQ